MTRSEAAGEAPIGLGGAAGAGEAPIGLFDPRRGESPKLLNRIEVVPSWQVRPLRAEGMVELIVWLPRGGNSYGHALRQIRVWDLPDLLEAYRADPEGLLEKFFGWLQPAGVVAPPNASPRSSPVVSTTVSSDDLGF